jgi:hypothetical protein
LEEAVKHLYGVLKAESLDHISTTM